MFSRTNISIFGVIILSFIGVAGQLYVTRWGVGVSPDSIAYIGAARNILEGNGLTLPYGDEINAPMTHHAPLYSFMLAGIASLGTDPIEAARWLNAIVFGATICIIGIMFIKLFPEIPWVAIAASFFILTSVLMITIHAYAWTEPLFILLGFLGLLSLGTYLDKLKRVFLIIAAVLFGLAFLTRYVGITLIFTGVLGILLYERSSLRKRIIEAGIFSAVSLLPTFVWGIRNLITSGTTTNREIVFHPVGKEQFWQALDTISGWVFFPSTTPSVMKIGVLLFVFIAVLAIILVIQREPRKSTAKSVSGSLSTLPSLVKLLILFIPVYMAFLVFSISFLDANTLLDDRILSPVYVAVVVLGFYLVTMGLLVAAKSRFLLALSISIIFLFLAFGAMGGVNWILDNQVVGIGFSSRDWQESAIIRQVDNLPSGITIYTNAPEIVYFLTGRSVYSLPRKIVSTTQQPNVNYEGDLLTMKERIDKEGGVVVYLYMIRRPTLLSEEELLQSTPLEVLSRAADGIIYASSSVQ